MRNHLAALALVALIAAGCGDAPAESTSSSTAEPTTAMKFAACMRENGVSEFPDPDPTDGLTIDGVLNGSSIDPDGAAWKEAISACKDLQPSGFTGRTRSAEQQDGALKFAECIRANGVKDFPDPAKGEPLVNTNLIPSSNSSRGMAILNAAMQACGDEAAEAMDGR